MRRLSRKDKPALVTKLPSLSEAMNSLYISYKYPDTMA